ncbi:hypothetical protein CTI14_71695, partial [Methylobacterium radiotolerans]
GEAEIEGDAPGLLLREPVASTPVNAFTRAVLPVVDVPGEAEIEGDAPGLLLREPVASTPVNAFTRAVLPV